MLRTPLSRNVESAPQVSPYANQVKHRKWCEALSSKTSDGGRRRPQTNPSYGFVDLFPGNQHGTTFLELPEKSKAHVCTSNVSGRHGNLRFVPRDPDVSIHFTRSSPSTPKLGPNQGRHLSGRAWQGNSEKQFFPGGLVTVCR